MGTGPSSPDEKGSTIAGLTTATTGSKRLNDEGFGIILVSKSSSSDSSSRTIAAFRFIDQIFRCRDVDVPTLHRKNSPMPANERTGGSEGGVPTPCRHVPHGAGVGGEGGRER